MKTRPSRPLNSWGMIAVLVLFPATIPAQEATDVAVIAAQLPTYPLEICPVDGRDLGEESVDRVHDGRLIRFCRASDEKVFKQEPAVYLAKIDAAVIEAQLPGYALEDCPISGMKLGGMGEPYNHVRGTRLVRFCCGGCAPKFEENPAAAFEKVDAALIDAQIGEYPYAMCPVMPANAIDAMGEPYDVLYGTDLVRLCCQKCVKEFRADPEKYMAVLGQMK